MKNYLTPLGSRPPDDHDAARQATLIQAVKDAASNRLSEAEIGEAVTAARVSRKDFNALVAEERRRLTAAREQRELADEQRRRQQPTPRALNQLTGGNDR